MGIRGFRSRAPKQPRGDQLTALVMWSASIAFVCQAGLMATWVVPPWEHIDNRIRFGLGVTAFLAISVIVAPEYWRKATTAARERLRIWLFPDWFRESDDEQTGPGQQG